MKRYATCFVEAKKPLDHVRRGVALSSKTTRDQTSVEVKTASVQKVLLSGEERVRSERLLNIAVDAAAYVTVTVFKGAAKRSVFILLAYIQEPNTNTIKIHSQRSVRP